MGFPRVRQELDLGKINEQKMREYIKSLSVVADEGANFADFVKRMKCGLLDTIDETQEQAAVTRTETTSGTSIQRMDTKSSMTRELTSTGARGSQHGVGRKGALEA